MTMALHIVGRGPSLPMSIRHYSRRSITGGRADPIWGIAHALKFSRKPPEDAPLVHPHGGLEPLTRFLNRVEEIAWLADTQHLELATTRAEMAANGIPSVSLDSESEEGMPQVSEGDLAAAPYTFDPALERRIEWERFMFACGPVHRGFFAPMKDGSLGIAYDGPEKKNVEFTLDIRRRVKTSWLTRHESLPTVEEAKNANAFNAYYGRPVLAYANPDDLRAEKIYGAQEDPDPGRDHLHAGYIQPCAHVQCMDIGYAGPTGTLGIDMDDEPEPGDVEP